MVVTPDTNIKLVHLDVSKEHQLTFTDLQSQSTFFQNLNGVELQASKYQRQDYKIRFPAWLDELDNYNYCFFNNPSYSNKYYYCYITNKEYVNDGVTDITIEVDVFQTYQFDFIYRQCYVEREHVNDDTRGLHTLPENLELGEYVQNDAIYDDTFDRKAYIIQVSKWEDETPVYGSLIGGQYFSGGFYITLSYQTVVDTVQFYTSSSSLGFEAILNIYMIPLAFTYLEVSDFSPATELKRFSQSAISITNFEITKPTLIDGYSPVNRKLLTFPYCYLTMSNNNGSSIPLQYENFKSNNGKCIFETEAIPTCGGSSRTYPIDYGSVGSLYCYQYGLAGGKYPVTDYMKDNYQIWLRQNMLNLNLGVAEGLLNIGVGLMQAGGGDVEGGIASMISSPSGLLGYMKQRYIHSMIPPTSATQTNTADLNISTLTNGFIYYKMSIKSEYARIIDNYFSMFGYKVSTKKIPNITGRQNWNYVQTVGAIVDGLNIPEKYIKEFEGMLNHGITFWHNPVTLKDYSQSNNII